MFLTRRKKENNKLSERAKRRAYEYMQEYEAIFNEPKTRTPNEYRKVLAAVFKKIFLTHHLYDRMIDEIVDITTSFVSKRKLHFRFCWVVFIAVTLDIEAEQIPSRSLTPKEIKTIEKAVEEVIPHNY